jgi:large subunit ribosomal protein L6
MKSRKNWRSVLETGTSRSSFRSWLLETTLSTHLGKHRIPSMASSLHCSRSSRALRNVFATTKTHDLILPTFLVPSLVPNPHISHFSSTTRCHSKIGRAPLSLPPEVTFRILETLPKRQSRGISRAEPNRSVEIEGPLGKMNMDIPPFVSIASNEETRTHTVNILDPEDKKQKAMWGEQVIYRVEGRAELIINRHDTGIPSKSHSRSQ